MGLETRRRNLEKSDLDSFSENKWNTQQNSSTQSKIEQLRDLKDLLDSLEEPIFSEQEAGKATINIELDKKEDARTFEEISNEEILKRIENLYR